MEDSDGAIPESFMLSQNYPYPFNPETTIQVDDLPRASEIDLAIYNLTGQKVATLAEGHRDAGTYTPYGGMDGKTTDRNSRPACMCIASQPGAESKHGSSCCCAERLQFGAMQSRSGVS